MVVVVVVTDSKLLSCLLLAAQCHSPNDIQDIWVWCCRHLPPTGHNETAFPYDYREDGLLTSLALEKVTMLRGSGEVHRNAFPSSHKPSTCRRYFLNLRRSFHCDRHVLHFMPS
ncbi:hypothetical protein BsWGS_18769 [Bradybaena similaris]